MQLVGELVAVYPDEPTESHVILPDWQKTLTGTVVAIGPGKQLRDGALAPMGVAVGDKIVFGAAIGMESVFNGKPLRIMRDGEIDVVLG
jgi:chaperonin GroES